MLLKSFISKQQHFDLIRWVNLIESLPIEANGKYCTFETLRKLKNIPKCVNDIRKKCLDITKDCLFEPILEDFVNEVKPNGFVSIHTDPTKKGYKHIRFNILLQKPSSGGSIVVDGNKINMNETDCFILDTSKQHGISIVYGDISYKSIVFGFLVPDEQVTFI